MSRSSSMGPRRSVRSPAGWSRLRSTIVAGVLGLATGESVIGLTPSWSERFERRRQFRQGKRHRSKQIGVQDRHRLDLVHLDDATVERHSTRPHRAQRHAREVPPPGRVLRASVRIARRAPTVEVADTAGYGHPRCGYVACLAARRAQPAFGAAGRRRPSRVCRGASRGLRHRPPALERPDSSK